ncbi:MAG: hypothetical protein QM770_21810 [Tepidisphaeraceae bacterium]
MSLLSRTLLRGAVAVVAGTLFTSSGFAWADDAPVVEPAPVEEVAPATQPADTFTGAWTISATPDDTSAQAGATAFTDDVLFHGGEFSASAYACMGFSVEQYTVVKDAYGREYFKATLTSADRGTLDWAGLVNDESKLYGRLRWTKTDGTTFHYRFTGSATTQ